MSTEVFPSHSFKNVIALSLTRCLLVSLPVCRQVGANGTFNIFHCELLRILRISVNCKYLKDYIRMQDTEKCSIEDNFNMLKNKESKWQTWVFKSDFTLMITSCMFPTNPKLNNKFLFKVSKLIKSFWQVLIWI